MEFVNSLKPIADLFGALLSPVIAITVAYIAYQQWKINSKKENREIRSSKINIYLRVKKLLRNVDETKTINLELYSDFQEALAEADFLLDDELIDWLEEVDAAATDWLDINEMTENSRKDLKANQSIKDYESWKKRNMEYIEKAIDLLERAHCEVIERFKKSVQD